jgi:hypothetical protein
MPRRQNNKAMNYFIKNYFNNSKRIINNNYTMHYSGDGKITYIKLINDEAIIFYRCYLVHILKEIESKSTEFTRMIHPEQIENEFNSLPAQVSISLHDFTIVNPPLLFNKLIRILNSLDYNKRTSFYTYPLLTGPQFYILSICTITAFISYETCKKLIKIRN